MSSSVKEWRPRLSEIFFHVASKSLLIPTTGVLQTNTPGYVVPKDELKAGCHSQPDKANRKWLRPRLKLPDATNRPNVKSKKNCSCNSGYLMGAQVAEVVAIPLLPNNAIKNTDRYHRKPCKNVPNDHVFRPQDVITDRGSAASVSCRLQEQG